MGGEVTQRCWLLLTLSLKGVLAGDWSVHLPSGPICAVTGSSLVLPCSYDYPQSSNETRAEEQLSTQGGGDRVLSEMWCLEDSRCITPRYVFHSAGIFPDPSYQNRVQYLGLAGTKNCSLSISDLRPSDSGSYVFYLITSHPTQKMPAQGGVQLLVADSSSAVSTSVSPSGGITEGVDLRLACCSPSANQQARFRWFKSTSATPRYNGQVWNISAVAPDDSGSYYCQMQTGEGEQNSTMLDIDVEYSPRNTHVSIFPPGELQRSLPVTLTCSSDANPPVHTFSWYQGAACLPAAENSFHQARQSPATSAGSTLSSTTISTEEYGQHCCVARNRHGSQTYSVTLTGIRAATPPKTTGRRVLLVGVCIGVLLVIIAIIAFLMRRKRSSHHQSYVLTATTATEA
ncbi:sialoadhesin-like isoform X2 [Hippoglossus hippoglossus]|uniref:sialoadhesin-like isoform X2 n=1 Tax=Hippoglossus hippoglossus TaxID=8267 RepID=UPI00148BACF3|nr:sialoadhesin-like isoform X2 [Hippoglossus hippoglossus]